MKKIFNLSILIIATLLNSCSSSEDAASVSRELTNGTWKLEFMEQYHFTESNALDHIDTVTTNANLEKLTFENDLNVTYINPSLIDPIVAKWSLSNSDEYLSTTLHKALGGSTITFYPHSKICEINKEKLVLQTDTITSTYFGGGQTIVMKQFEKYHYQH